jgi:hypothetical protein
MVWVVYLFRILRDVCTFKYNVQQRQKKSEQAGFAGHFRI